MMDSFGLYSAVPVDVRVGVGGQNVVLGPQDFHSFLGILLQLLLGLRGLQGKVAEQVYKLSGLASVGGQLWPDGPGQVQQQLLLRLTGVSTEGKKYVFLALGG